MLILMLTKSQMCKITSFFFSNFKTKEEAIKNKVDSFKTEIKIFKKRLNKL